MDERQKFHVKRLEQLVKSSATFWGTELPEEHLMDLIEYARLVDGYREANITGARDLETIVRDHVIDSISCLSVGVVKDAVTGVDVGSGAGFPAIPLAIMSPKQRWTLVEATGKKGKFLEYIVEKLRLDNVRIITGRVEEVGRDRAHREAFDLATSRAVSSMGVLIEYCVPLLKTGGTMVAMKARLRPEELEEARHASAEVGSDVSEIVKLETPEGIEAKERNLVLVRKHARTSGGYPRQVGVPRKSPLGT